MADGIIVQGDLLPALIVHIEKSDGTPVDLTGASVQFVVKAPGGTYTNDATILDAVNGIVQHDWTPDETSKAGTLFVRQVVTWSGKPQTYPGIGPFQITVRVP